MAWDPHGDTAIHGLHAPGVGAGEPRASAATCRVEGAPAAAAAHGYGPDILGRAVEALEELAEFAADGAARDRGRLAPPGFQAVLGMEESTPMGSARDWEGTAGSDSADEPRESALGCTEDPRRAVEAGPDGFAGDGFAVHAPASAAAVAGMARISDEPCPRSDRVGFLHGADGDLSSALCADRTEPRPASAGAFQCHRAPDGGMDGTTTDRGVRAGREPSASDRGPGSGLWRTILASSAAVGHPGGGHCATLAMAKHLCGAGDWLAAAGMP